MRDLLRPTKQRKNNKRIWGFDIETYDSNRKFLLASVWSSENLFKVYHEKEEFITDLRLGKFNNSIIVATNLTFDFFGTFFHDSQGFNFIFRGSELIYAKTYIYNRQLNKKSNRHKNSVTFLDTMNYAKMSVEKLGKIIGIPKLPHPKCLGKLPSDDKELKEMIEYNLNDSRISCEALKFLYSSFEKLGATPKLTLASTSMSLFRNKYLKQEYWRHDEHILLEQFKGYYGGRTEAFSRGKIKDFNYYDFNSLYPSVMKNEFPDPNTLRINKKNTDFYIQNYDGMSDVTISCPHDMNYPLLPFRTETKLIFPTGTFRGWYCHNELRRAIELGYHLLKVHKCHYYLENCRPMSEFVSDLYAKRREYQKAGSPMEIVVKILMNSLYGKFGQKFMDKDNILPFDHTVEELDRFKFWEFVGDSKEYIRIKQDRIPSPFCIPIWASYVTSYGRLKLHEAMLYSNPIYCDTDSLITKKKFKDSKELGELKLEHYIDNGIIVKPKFYMINDMVKSKGIGTKIVMKDFMRLIIDKKITYDKFMKIRESLRRGFIPNEITEITKHLNLNDDKRIWDGDFDAEILSHSSPININEVGIYETTGQEDIIEIAGQQESTRKASKPDTGRRSGTFKDTA